MAHLHVLVIGDDVAGQLARYDENRSVAPYKVRVTSENVEGLAMWAAIQGREAIPFDAVANSGGDAQFLARRVARWTGCQTGIDLDGVYYMSTANPDGKWDGWSSAHKNVHRGLELQRDPTCRVVSARKRDIVQPIRPVYLWVLKYGHWHEIPYSRRWSDEQHPDPPAPAEDERVLRDFDALLSDIPDDTMLTVVHCHTIA